MNYKTQEKSNKINKKWQRGLSLIEASMVLILSAVVVAGVMSYYQTAQNNNKLEETLSETLSIVAGIQATFTNEGSYDGLSTLAVVHSGYVPSTAISTDGKSIVNAFGTPTEVAPTDNGGKDPATGSIAPNYTVVLRSLDSEQCAKIAGQKIVGNEVAVSVEDNYTSKQGMTSSQITQLDDVTPVTIAALCAGGTSGKHDVVFLMK